MSLDFINIIFGMKVRQARQEMGLTLSEFASQCELSPSYLTEIEKGRKYPRSDKIMKMADALGKGYDDLVSIKLPPSLTYLESTLSSMAVQRFPLEEFGLEPGDLITLLTREPVKASALLHAVLEIIRRFNLDKETFLRAALRSYQEIHENYFPELEDAAQHFMGEISEKYPQEDGDAPSLTRLESILKERFNYDFDDSTLTSTADLSTFRAVTIKGKRPKLYINNRLYSRQVRFILAREIGYNYLGIKERSYTSTPETIDTFQQLLNDFKAAYFGGAILMPRASFLKELQAFFDNQTWSPEILLAMLSKYNVTPEMLLYRFSELVPQFFGLKLHFLRFHHTLNATSYHLVKQLNMNQLLVPSGIGLNEHYCRRWLSVRLLREVSDIGEPQTVEEMPIGIQHSEFLETQDRFLCLGLARQLVLSSDIYSSVLVGFRVDADLKNSIRFWDDPSIPHTIINETCERCSLAPNLCHLRAAPPASLAVEEEKRARRLALSMLHEG